MYECRKKLDYNLLILKSNGLCIGARSVSGLYHVGGQKDMSLKSNCLCISAGRKVDYNSLVLENNGLCIGAGSVSGLHHVSGQRTCH
jgi:hypothetical protein